MNISENSAGNSPEEDEAGTIHSRSYLSANEDYTTSSKYFYKNFIIFCTCFSISHATVDTVLAFSIAQLGSKAGSYSGFILYILYTLSALCIAKSSLRLYGPKSNILYGIRYLSIDMIY